VGFKSIKAELAKNYTSKHQGIRLATAFIHAVHHSRPQRLPNNLPPLPFTHRLTATATTNLPKPCLSPNSPLRPSRGYLSTVKL